MNGVDLKEQNSKTNDCEEMAEIRKALSDVTNKMEETVKKYEKKILSLQRRLEAQEEEVCALDDNLESLLQKYAYGSEEQDDDDFEMEKTEIHDNDKKMSLNDELHQTKSGKSYSLGLRKLYYNLLVSGMPPGSIHLTIKKILHHFLPNIDTCDLNLPKQSCAQYMRSEELKTVNDAHKAVKLTEKPTNFHFNSDGTTLKQHKIAAATINGLVLSVNEVPDGTAEQIARDMSCELDHLRKTAEALDLPNAECINWGAMASITSDSAATQKKFNSIAKTLERRGYSKVRKIPCGE